jgi:hypothetical protein
MHPRFPMPPEPGLFWAAGKIAAIQLACLAAMLALASALLPTHDATAEEAAGKKNVRELHERYQQQIPRLAAPCSADRVVLEAKSFEGTRKPSRPELIGQRFFVTRYGEDPRESDPQRQDQYYRIEGPAGVFTWRILEPNLARQPDMPLGRRASSRTTTWRGKLVPRSQRLRSGTPLSHHFQAPCSA